MCLITLDARTIRQWQKDCNENILFAELKIDQMEQYPYEIDRQQQKTDTNYYYFNKRTRKRKNNIFDSPNG